MILVYTRTITSESCLDEPYDGKIALRLDIRRALFVNKKQDSAKAKPFRLGVAWKILDPFFHTMVYFFVFTVIRFNTNVGSLMIGIAMIQTLQANLAFGVRSGKDYTGGLKIERIRTRVIVIADLLHVISDSLYRASSTLIVLLILGSSLWAIPAIPLLFLLNGLTWYSIGRSMIFISFRFKDFENFITYFSMMMFFMSPALYPLNMTKGLHRQFNLFNPFSYVSEPARAISFGQDSYQLLIPWVGGLIFMIVSAFLIHGFWMMDKQRWKWSPWF